MSLEEQVCHALNGQPPEAKARGHVVTNPAWVISHKSSCCPDRRCLESWRTSLHSGYDSLISPGRSVWLPWALCFSVIILCLTVWPPQKGAGWWEDGPHLTFFFFFTRELTTFPFLSSLDIFTPVQHLCAVCFLSLVSLFHWVEISMGVGVLKVVGSKA